MAQTVHQELDALRRRIRALEEDADQLKRDVRQLKRERAMAAPVECMIERLAVLEAFLGPPYRQFEAAHRAEIVNR